MAKPEQAAKRPTLYVRDQISNMIWLRDFVLNFRVTPERIEAALLQAGANAKWSDPTTVGDAVAQDSVYPQDLVQFGDGELDVITEVDKHRIAINLTSGYLVRSAEIRYAHINYRSYLFQ